MNRTSSSALVRLASLLSVIVTLASVYIGAAYGYTVIKPSDFPMIGSESVTIINWPLLFGLGVAVLYSFCFTTLAIQMDRTHDRIADIHNKLNAGQPN